MKNTYSKNHRFLTSIRKALFSLASLFTEEDSIFINNKPAADYEIHDLASASDGLSFSRRYYFL
ncbi:MAG: hypothetical protein SPL99_08560 [Catonella sp.]|jgi:hypothetical protein|nr:hypothetical protein [Catonella sp.]MDY6356717.1 hypothetical protein [Catonella sp.]